VLGLVAGLLGAVQIEVMVAGLATSTVAGLAAIWGLLCYLQRASTMVFIVYRIALGLGLLVLVLVR
jgi:undecaprenyl pyrophosphate phosphatase UppP